MVSLSHICCIGQSLRTMTGHTDFVRSLTQHYLDGQWWLLSGSADSTIRMWSMSTSGQVDMCGEWLNSHISISSEYYHIPPKPDDHLTSDRSNILHLYYHQLSRTRAGQTAFCWAGEKDPVNAIRMLFEYQSYYWERKFASFAISCWWCTQQCFTVCIRLFRSRDRTVKCWDTKKPSVPLWSLKADDSKYGVWSICQMSDGRLVSGGDDNTLKIWKYDWNCW